MTRLPIHRFRWVAPDGRASRWFKTIGGTIRSAVRNRHSSGAVSIKFCTRSSLALWPSLAADGWKIEKTDKRVK